MRGQLTRDREWRTSVPFLHAKLQPLPKPQFHGLNFIRCWACCFSLLGFRVPATSCIHLCRAALSDASPAPWSPSWL